MNSTRVLTMPGDGYTLTAGNKTVHVHYQGFGAGSHLFRIEVTGNGPVAVGVGDDDRSYGHPDRATAQAQADAYAARLVELYTFDSVDVDALAAAINADLDANDAPLIAEQAQLAQDVAAITATPWTRHTFKRNAPALPGGVTGKPSPAGEVLLKRMAREGGRIYRGRGASCTQLRALARENLVRLTMRPGSRRFDVDYADLDTAGIAYLASIGVHVAEVAA